MLEKTRDRRVALKYRREESARIRHEHPRCQCIPPPVVSRPKRPGPVREVLNRNNRIVQEAAIFTVRTTGMIFLILWPSSTICAFARLATSQQISENIVGLKSLDQSGLGCYQEA